MKQETNNEIDLLLRRLSRRDAVSTPDSGHLDADELNSYAENALPAAARARYTEHLAECSRCRELVVQLSSAAGVVMAEEPARIAAPSGLRKFLASLFSPMVLRYAVPAIGLTVVAVIGFTISRNGPQSNSPDTTVTIQRTAETPAVAQQTKPEVLFDDQAKSGGVSPSPELRRQRNEAEPPAPTPLPAANAQASQIKEAPADKTDSKTVATAAPPPAAPKPAETGDEVRKKEAEEQKQETQDRAAATPQTERSRVFQSERETALGAAAARRPAKRGALTTPDNQGAGMTSGAAAPESLGKDRDDAETRTVEGRRFRKKHGIWVDTAYADGPIVGVTRGSEQYRGLVADEPQIKKIADQLDGQIIVVWKGQAYHIR